MFMYLNNSHTLYHIQIQSHGLSTSNSSCPGGPGPLNLNLLNLRLQLFLERLRGIPYIVQLSVSDSKSGTGFQHG